MKQAMKRFGAMLLTMAMLLSLAVTGVSAESETSAQSTTGGKTVSITFDDLGADTLKAYQVIKYNATENAFEDADTLGDKISFWEYLNKEKGNTYPDAAQFLASKITSNDLRAFLKEFLTTDNTGLPATSAFTATNSSQVTGVEPGYYILQVESSSKIYNTMLLFVGYKDGKLVAEMNGSKMTGTDNAYTATVKSQPGPTVEKYVFDDHDGRTELTTVENWKKTAASEVGKKVDFAIKVKLPLYPNDADVTLILADTLKNFQYSADDDVEVYYKNGKKYDVIADAAEFVSATDGSETPTTYANGKQTMNIALKYSVLKDKITAETEFYVHYKATLREDAVTDNAHSGTNNVTLNYTVKTSAGEYIGKPAAEEVTVYTYNFKLDKTYTGNDTMTGAEFSVYTGLNEAAKDVDTTRVMYFKEVTEGGNTYYYPVASDAEGAVKSIPADFEIRGLDVNTPYYVKEVKTAPGYYLPTSYFTLELGGNELDEAPGVLNGELKYGADYKGASSFVAAEPVDQQLVTEGRGDDNGKYGQINTTNEYEYDVTLNNSSTPVLPSTGGMGTTLFTVGGVALLALAAAMLILRRRKN